jgi:hypothetical protein
MELYNSLCFTFVKVELFIFFVGTLNDKFKHHLSK